MEYPSPTVHSIHFDNFQANNHVASEGNPIDTDNEESKQAAFSFTTYMQQTFNNSLKNQPRTKRKQRDR